MCKIIVKDYVCGHFAQFTSYESCQRLLVKVKTNDTSSLRNCPDFAQKTRKPVLSFCGKPECNGWKEYLDRHGWYCCWCTCKGKSVEYLGKDYMVPAEPEGEGDRKCLRCNHEMCNNCLDPATAERARTNLIRQATISRVVQAMDEVLEDRESGEVLAIGGRKFRDRYSPEDELVGVEDLSIREDGQKKG